MAEARQSSEAVPVQFGKYLLDGEIARGGMSRVYRARLRGPGGFEKKLVVKQILPHLAQDPSFIELFVREANTLVQMSHGNIVPVYELGVVDGVYFLAMELVPGATIAEILGDGPLPQELVAQIGVQVCEALRYAHDRFELVHRDVTPRNVIVDSDGHVRLLDFGIAAPLAHTGQGERFGSPGYMSPEQVGGRALSARSDLFSLGTVLYEAATGERAIARGDEKGVPAQLSPGEALDADLCEVINDLLAVDPAARPGSAREVAARLRRWIAEHHPGGVAARLGERAEAARAREPEQPKPEADVEPGDTSQTPQVTRSIATSQALDAIISQATEPLSGRAHPSPPPAASEASGRRGG
ncbi:MAG: serine/threonine-protein kinase, partial [Myxococcales bacterium]|nr:serine/threonine-protein kinase [Myxococcales bacterium]